MATSMTPRFLSLVVHDLRTPLNVIGLTLGMLEPLGRKQPEYEEDLRIIRENLHQMERMLAHLSDYCRLGEGPTPLSPAPFDPRRLLADLLDDQAMRGPAGRPPARLEVREGCPDHVELDQARASQALTHALTNATNAADGRPVRVVLDGDPDRLVVRIAVDRPPPASVKSLALRPDGFERLHGTAADRFGLELALAAQVTEAFGGTARLDVDQGEGTTLVFEWPARLREAPQAAGT